MEMNTPQLVQLKASVEQLQSALWNAITLSVIAANNNGFDYESEQVVQNYWNMVLEFLHVSEQHCDKLTQQLNRLNLS